MTWTKRSEGLFTGEYNGCFAMIFRAPGTWQRWAWEARFGMESASGVVYYKREARQACWDWCYDRLRRLASDLNAEPPPPVTEPTAAVQPQATAEMKPQE